MSVTVYGASDDLIEIEGDVEEEFSARGEADDDLIGMSNGVLLRVRYDSDGVWRITTLADPQSLVVVTQAPADDEDNYSDRAVVSGPVAWVVYGTDWAK